MKNHILNLEDSILELDDDMEFVQNSPTHDLQKSMNS